MMRVSLHFEDDPELPGAIAFRADYAGGYAPQSNAHKLAGQVIKFLDDQASARVERLPEGPVTVEDYKSGLWTKGQIT